MRILLVELLVPEPSPVADSNPGLLCSRPMPPEKRTKPGNSESPSVYDPEVALEFFRSAGKEQTIAGGTTIFSENRKGMPLLLMPNRIYLLLEGEVGVLARDEPIATIRAGEIFGEMASMGQMPRSASAVAKTDCRVIGLDDAQFQAALGRNPGFALMLISIMAKRLRDTIGSLCVPASPADSEAKET